MAALATLLRRQRRRCCWPSLRRATSAPEPLAVQRVTPALEAMRTVPEIVFALILVWAFGVGPLAGILAIALHTAGACGKLFAEAIENTGLGAWDGGARRPAAPGRRPAASPSCRRCCRTC